MDKVIVIDDDQAVLNYLNIFLLQAGTFEVTTLSDSTKAYDALKNGVYDLLLLDMDMPEITGLDILKKIHEEDIDIQTIVLTGVEDIELAVSAMKLGALEYLTKPVDVDRLLNLMRSALEQRRLSKDMESESKTAANLRFKEAFKEVITQDTKMNEIFIMIEKMALTDNSVLIWGESGTGKELIARAIHKISKRSGERFVAVNAGAFANELFASEFFGYNQGAFTGATSNKKGFLEEADKGTLFLDEIGELALPTQVKLLRVLQEGEFFRLSSTKNQKVDVRIIAATNKNLQEEMRLGNFRKDLFYRLNINSVYLPPLRERKGDVKLLVDYFIKKYSTEKTPQISTEVYKMLEAYPWPGNIRELQNACERAVLLSRGGPINEKYFMLNGNALTNKAESELAIRAGLSVSETEKRLIIETLRVTDNNRTRAAELLGISIRTLRNKLNEYGEVSGSENELD